jgi:hypothetical protein
MRCCAVCFGDRALREMFIPLRSRETGRCSYCDSENVSVIAPAQISELFVLLISAYKADEQGKLLVEWFREDWGMFEHPRMDNPRARDLLADILEDNDVVRQMFSPAFDTNANRLGQWEMLREELMFRNRFFPEADIDRNRLANLLSQLVVKGDEVQRVWFRARIQTGEAPFTVDHMGAPPRRLASYGRANPAGIPYLYLGSTPEASISEIRPHTGELVCVADFRTPEGLKLIDLQEPRRMVSPFLLEDAADICGMRDDLPFLERLGEELTRPVLPQAAAIDYTPSQYLCEFIKRRGYDGVLYRSSVGKGVNLALFNPTGAGGGEVTQFHVDQVAVKSHPVAAG